MRRVHILFVVAVHAGLVMATVSLSGCFTIRHIGMDLLYREEALPVSRIVVDVPYREDAAFDPHKHRLDLFLPVGEGWPTVLFVHGGGWRSGDKAYRFAGADIYRNIGRYLARRGIGTAVISYRLLPMVSWQDQFDDVARATSWVHRHIDAYGGNPDRVFLMGHSAGAHLISRVAFDASQLEPYGLTPDVVCGVVGVSGAAYDLTDEDTYVGGGLSYFERRFGGTENWQEEASTLPYVTPAAPPFLVLYGGKEPSGLQRQSQLLDQALRAAGVASTVIVVPGQSHARMILALSRDDKIAGPAVVAFVRHTPCG